mgnify:CR=1 FL=1
MLSFKVGLLTIEHRPDDLEPETIGKNVLMRRTAFNLTQAQVAFDAGRCASTVARIERGWPCMESTLENVAGALGTTSTNLRKADRPVSVSKAFIAAVLKVLENGSLPLEYIHFRLPDKHQTRGYIWRKSFRSALEEMADEGYLSRDLRSVYGLGKRSL